MRQQHIDELGRQLFEIDTLISGKSAQIKDIDCVGLVVNHKVFGRGTVAEAAGNRIIIEFDTKGRKILDHPGTVLKGILCFDDVSVTEHFCKNEEIKKEITDLLEQQKHVEEELSAAVEEGSKLVGE